EPSGRERSLFERDGEGSGGPEPSGRGQSLFERDGPAQEPPTRRPSMFEKPAVLQQPAAPTTSPDMPETPSERPSLFVKPASLGGPGSRAAPADVPAAGEEADAASSVPVEHDPADTAVIPAVSRDAAPRVPAAPTTPRTPDDTATEARPDTHTPAPAAPEPAEPDAEAGSAAEASGRASLATGEADSAATVPEHETGPETDDTIAEVAAGAPEDVTSASADEPAGDAFAGTFGTATAEPGDSAAADDMSHRSTSDDTTAVAAADPDAEPTVGETAHPSHDEPGPTAEAETAEAAEPAPTGDTAETSEPTQETPAVEADERLKTVEDRAADSGATKSGTAEDRAAADLTTDDRIVAAGATVHQVAEGRIVDAGAAVGQVAESRVVEDSPAATHVADDRAVEDGGAAADQVADDRVAESRVTAGLSAGDGADDGVGGEELPAELVEALTSALGTLRETVAGLRFGLDLPGVEEARKGQAALLAQLDDYVLPRIKTSTAPALIVVAGSTGAGKSTLVNSLAEKNVSRTGVRRPTTGHPVLACHPDDHRWFAEGELLGGLPRLSAPGDDKHGLVIVATQKLPQGVALLDTPDIDSVVEEHHEIAHRMLDVADLWIFVTTAARYADAPAWSLLRLAKERGARLAIVLSRVPQKSSDVVLKHFVRMLTEYGLGEIDRFVVHESEVTDGRLPDAEVTELRLWLAELSVDERRRARAVRETLDGVLNSFRTRVPALAKQLEAQVAFRAELRSDVEAAFLGALAELDRASRNGSLLHGEVLARWQDFAGSGDLIRSLRVRKRGRAGRQVPERVLAFKAAVRAGLESVIIAAANQACEEVAARWRHRAELGAKLGEDLDRPSDDLVRHTTRAIASWQDHLLELVRTEGVAKRSVSKIVKFDPDSLALIFMVAMFSGGAGEGVPHRLVNALLGAESLRAIGAKALTDLRARVGMLFDEEALRYAQALDSAGIPDESAATRLYQATYNLEVAR
ncbi:GTPase, partial [Nonomuraea maritima]